MSDQHLLEAYLTEYQPQRKADLERSGMLATYLDEQAAAMNQARLQLHSAWKQHSPTMSETQRALEVEEHLRALFMPLPSLPTN